MNPYPGGYQQQMNHPYGNGTQMNGQSVFHNPLQPVEEKKKGQPSIPYGNGGNAYMNPYPKQSMMQKQSGMQSIMNSFKGQDGSLDFNKMVDTAGQMMNAVNQVSSMVKGIGGFFKA
nr:YppG family protein [Cytobacillus spongiae]